jgi:hypothetical protein
MSIITRTRRSVNSNPFFNPRLPSGTTRTLFDSTRRLKAPYAFGKGLLAGRLVEHRDHTAADEAWAAAAFNGSDWDDNTVIDQRAAEFHAVDRLCRGYCL